MDNSPKLTKDEREFYILQFNALREEILQRSRHMFQLIVGGLAGNTLFVGVGFGFDQLVLAYASPLFTVVLILLLLHESNAIIRAGGYIREKVEKGIGSKNTIGWEN